MWRYLFVGLIGLLIFCSSCRNDFETVPSNGTLTFSKDTVYLDTTFTDIGSATYMLKVYNRSKKDILIPSIKLGKGDNSFYRLMVDGIPGKSFNNIELLAQDSLFIFIETTIDYDKLNATENTFLYTDKLIFDEGSNPQKVELVTLVKDAVFLYPKKNEDGTIETIVVDKDAEGNNVTSNGFYLTDEQLNWSNKKPYVIYGYAAVPANKILNITARARIHFHDNSGILVTDKASIKAIGDYSETKSMENQIVFEGDKLQSLYSDAPGQWNGIWLKPESINNVFEHVTIKNAKIGIKTEAKNTSALTLKNVQLYNHLNFGIYAINAKINAENTVINQSGQSSLGIYAGGNYHFKHSTISNYWSSSIRKGQALFISNQIGNISNPLVNATFDNCIVYGSGQMEITLSKNESQPFNYLFNHCLIRFNDQTAEHKNNPLYDFSNELIAKNIILNKEPLFFDAPNNDLRITKQSNAVGLSDILISTQVPLDLLKKDRTTSPDAGAYQSSDVK